jgi:germination protein, Ger(x)C family
MRRQFISKLALGLTMLLGLTTGCGDQKVLERLGFTHTTSYDLTPQKEGQQDKQLTIAVSIPKADAEGKVRRETLLTTAHTSKEAKIELSKKTELMMVSGQLRNTLFGVKLAKQGLWRHIDTLVRDPSISGRVKVTIVNGEAWKVLLRDYPDHPRTGQYIDRLLEKESRTQSIPQISVYEFVRNYYDDGIDPIAPIIKGSDNEIEADGIALFDDDRYVSKIPLDRSVIYSILRGVMKRGEMSMDLNPYRKPETDPNEYVMLNSVYCRRAVKVKRTGNGRPAVHLQVELKGSVQEYTGSLHIFEDRDREQLAHMIERYVAAEAKDMMAFMQKNKVDSAGIGQYVRNSLSFKEWKSLDWDKVYPETDITISVKVKIKDYGKSK